LPSLTTRINSLTGHLQSHKRDFACRARFVDAGQSPAAIVGLLKKVDPQRYLDVNSSSRHPQ